MRGIVALLAFLTLAPAAHADPCRPPAPKRPPSAELLSSLGVLRRPPTPADRPPADVRAIDGRPYAGAARWVPLDVGGGVWIVPLFDISQRVAPSEACIRTLPRRLRGHARRAKRADRRKRRLEGLRIMPYDAAGESRGVAEGGVLGVRAGAYVHLDGVRDGRSTRVIGLVPDGVATVRVAFAAHRDERGRPVPAREAPATVRDNVYGVDVPVPLDLESIDPVVTWLDAEGGVVPQR